MTNPSRFLLASVLTQSDILRAKELMEREDGDPSVVVIKPRSLGFSTVIEASIPPVRGPLPRLMNRKARRAAAAKERRASR